MLSCGSGGSTGEQIVAAINENTNSRGYYHASAQDTLGIEDIFIPLCDVALPDADGGVYEIKFSVTFKHASITNSTLLKLLFNGNEEIYSYEASDIENLIPTAYVFPYEHSSGDITVAIEMARGGGTAQLDCFFSNVVIEKKSTDISAP